MTDEQIVRALDRIASAIVMQAESNTRLASAFDKMERGMIRMVGTISGAQKKIGVEAGEVIERSKKVHAKLIGELQKQRDQHADS